MKYLLTLLLLALSLYATASGNLSGHVTLAVQAENRNDLPGAILHYKNALEKRLNKNSRIEILNNIGVLYFKLKNYSSAIQAFNRCRELDETNALVWNNLGLCYEKTGKNSEAEKAYLYSIQLKTDYTDPYINLLNLYYVKGDYRAALNIGKKLLRIEPFVPHVLHGLGQICLKMQDTENARLFFEETAAIDPGYENSLLELAAIYFDRKDRENFIRVAKGILVIQPREEIYIALAYTYFEMNQFRVAHQYIQKALETTPDNKNALNVLESIYLSTRNYKAALSIREKLYRMGEKSAESSMKLALYYQKTGFPDKALNIYLKLRQQKKIPLKQFIQLSTIYFPLGRYRDAAGLLLKAGYNVKNQINLGWAYIRLKHFIKARNHFELLLKKYPNNVKVKENYYLSLIFSGNPHTALKGLFELREKTDSPYPSLYIALYYLVTHQRQMAETYFKEAFILDTGRIIDYKVDILQEKAFSVFIRDNRLRSIIYQHFNSAPL